MTTIKLESPASYYSRVFEWFGIWAARFAFGAVIILFFSAPITALSWRRLPFPGFLVEQTLVVNDYSGNGWTGIQAGISPGERIIRIAGLAVSTPAEYDAALASLPPGTNTAVFTILHDGSGRLYPQVALMRLPIKDFFRLFWLPYLTGLIYFFIAGWIYRACGTSHSGLALTFFCLLTSTVAGLFFDLSTSHSGPVLWTIALTLLAPSLISLAMCFPREWSMLRGRLWLLLLPYVAALPLVIWNLVVLYDPSNPWAYYESWGASYRLSALAILFFIGVMFYQAFRGSIVVVRRQARMVLLGSLMAFIPVFIWLVSPIVNRPMEFNPAFFLPALVLFPLSVAVAILRYRLLEIDAIINRTLVYSLLTAILAGIFTAVIAFSQRMFIAITGEKSDAAIVITTLVVGSAITPVRTFLQQFVDRQFKEDHDQSKALKTFYAEVNSYIQLSTAEHLTGRLLDESARAVQAANGAWIIADDAYPHPRIMHTYQNWKGEIHLNIPVEHEGRLLGYLQLGPRLNGKPYTRDEYQILSDISRNVAAAVQISRQ